MKDSRIEWTDHTFNPWEGCSKISPGCAHCYAEARNKRFSAGANWGPGAPRRRTSNWRDPLRWNDLYPGTRVFCASLADWLDDEVPVQWLADLFNLIVHTPNLKWQLLTKRPENFGTRMAAALDYYAGDPFYSRTPKAKDAAFEWLAGNSPYNVWIGTTVEDQAKAEERIPHLIEIPAVTRFLSCEPLLGPINLRYLKHPTKEVWCDALTGPDYSPNPDADPVIVQWVIAGGETGHGARPMSVDWVRSLRDQCAEAYVPFFFKQWGSNPAKDAFTTDPVNAWMQSQKGGRLLDGQLHNAFPHA